MTASTRSVAFEHEILVFLTDPTALMSNSSRFRRLFNSVSAFALILPPIFFAYAQAESIPAIQDAIEYAFRRFFNVHQESMVFQTIAAVSAVVLHREVKVDDHRRWISGGLFELLRSLDGSPSGSAGSPVGIRGANEAFEREALVSLQRSTYAA